MIVGYFLEDRTSQELAHELGVTESRVSQLRSEALQMLREGIEAQYDDGGRSWPPSRPSRGGSPDARPRYASAIRDASGWRSRLERFAPLPVSLAG